MEERGTDRSMTIQVLGVRGSLPVPSRETLEYGGNTSCMAVRYGDERLILDAGSGLATYDAGGGDRFHILLSHLHLDHVIGLFGFGKLFDPGAEIHFYGAGWHGEDLRARLGALFTPPYWPVRLTELPSRVVFHELCPGDAFSPAPGLEVTTLRGCHPNGSLLYRLDAGGRSLVYGLDCELDEECSRTVPEFARDTDLLVWDATYAPGHLKPGWGHSTWEQGLAVGESAGARRVLMAHYDRGYDDAFLREQERSAAAASAACLFAKEGMEIRL